MRRNSGRLGFALALTAAVLGAQPRRLDFDRASPKVARVPPRAVTGNWIDTSNREAVRQTYLSAIPGTAGVGIGWTGGNVGACQAGDTAQAYKDAVLARVNFFRGMAGVPQGVTLDATLNAKAQQAALIMAANQTLNHTPPSNYLCYSPAGAEAAGRSNLCSLFGFVDIGCVAGYIEDQGASNAAAGHRRWLLYPQLTVIGTGDIPQNGAYPYSNALYVIPSQATARPATRNTYVAWPPPGYVPYPLMFARWSFSYPSAGFSQAAVTVTRNGQALAVQLEPQTQGYGENAIVWTVSGFMAAAGADTPFHITVSNVSTGSGVQSFEYDVIMFDPAVASGPGTGAAAATYRDGNGAIHITRYGDAAAPNGPGSFASAPASARMPNGDYVAVVRDSSGALWWNRFFSGSGAWSVWTGLGGLFLGDPAIAVTSGGTIAVAGRDTFNSYWIGTVVPGGTPVWRMVGGIFATDPALAAGPNDRVFMAGRDRYGSLWTLPWTPAGGPGSWIYGAGIVQGKPGLTVGLDGRAYLAARDNWNALWVAWSSDTGWGGWSYGAGVLGGDLDITALGNGYVRAAGRDTGGALYYRDFAEGGTGWLGWTAMNGLLQELRGMSLNGEYFATGRDFQNQVWWYRGSANVWTGINAAAAASSVR